ncbi:hypothetical protein CPB86DRAFT_782638 [Serendipita vermifera]|nr:hypothetical protein CPB86DRAFT_782638 [Serendipita vermifera]
MVRTRQEKPQRRGGRTRPPSSKQTQHQRKETSLPGEDWMLELKKQEQKNARWDLKTVFWSPEETFQVEFIEEAKVVAADRKKRLPRRWMYLVKWFNWPVVANTWENRRVFDITTYPIISQFWMSTPLQVEREPSVRGYQIGTCFRSSQQYKELIKIGGHSRMEGRFLSEKGCKNPKAHY